MMIVHKAAFGRRKRVTTHKEVALAHLAHCDTHSVTAKMDCATKSISMATTNAALSVTQHAIRNAFADNFNLFGPRAAILRNCLTILHKSSQKHRRKTGRKTDVVQTRALQVAQLPFNRCRQACRHAFLAPKRSCVSTT